ncbi:MAG TPA: response regulator transcription factor [Terriglobia bacterium]|nr:response regulator transcription factor [Terriglobia bacterium]
MKRRILVVEDDVSLARVLCDNLVYEGFDVALAADGNRALKEHRVFNPDLVLLDLTLPGLDGFEVCRKLNREQSRTGIIILTARTQKEDKLQGLRLGADDYITKPFALDELLARIEAVMRRLHPADDGLSLGSLHIDFNHYTAERNNEKVAFSQREIEVLRYMSARAGKVVTRDELLRNVWGYQNIPLTRSVDNLIARLRWKIEPDPDNPRYIHTVYGDGYRLTLDAPRRA